MHFNTHNIDILVKLLGEYLNMKCKALFGDLNLDSEWLGTDLDLKIVKQPHLWIVVTIPWPTSQKTYLHPQKSPLKTKQKRAHSL